MGCCCPTMTQEEESPSRITVVIKTTKEDFPSVVQAAEQISRETDSVFSLEYHIECDYPYCKHKEMTPEEVVKGVHTEHGLDFHKECYNEYIKLCHICWKAIPSDEYPSPSRCSSGKIYHNKCLDKKILMKKTQKQNKCMVGGEIPCPEGLVYEEA